MLENIFAHLVYKKVFSNKATMHPLNKGESGATLYTAEDNSKWYIVKHMENETPNSDFFKKEYPFYKICNNFNLDFLPEVIYAEENKELGVIIVLKHYNAITPSEWTMQRQMQAVDVIAKIHSMSSLFINALDINAEPPKTTDAIKLKKSYENWINILNKFEDMFDMKILNDIYQNFDFDYFKNLNKKYFCHGDFHCENILTDESGKMILVDWQSYALGDKSEIAFFISRGYDFGIDMQEEAIKKYYCERLSFYTKSDVPILELEIECNASTVLVTFEHWADYLQDANADRVKPIFEKMATAFQWLASKELF